MRPDLPTGTVTFLFTDAEGSTRLLHELGAEAYAEALAEHRRVIREACVAEGGVEVDTQGDAFFFAFPTAPGALAAAAAFTEALVSGPVQVRVGLHTGTPLLTEEGYVGDDVHRAARIAAAGHGGQVVVSSSTASLVDTGLHDLGEHRFKDLAAAERVYQAGDGEFPPLRSLYRSNLPIPAHALVGRKKELLDVMRLLRADGGRIVTLTGPGGVGKTRFAVAVAGEVSDAFPDGVWFVPLSPVRDPELVLPTIASVVGADGELEGHFGGEDALLLLDNLEQVIAAATEIADLVSRCPRLRVLVTSRESLRVAPEQEYPLAPLPASPSVELFRQRAAAVAPEQEIDYEAASAICDHLDRLPLAIELAAARAKALSPTQMLDRLSERLDLLKGGRDADPRQQTLRATIEWSYDLLTEDEQQLFGRLSIFAGGCTLEAAEEVCGADLDTLQSLVEKSLVRFTNERYWMLETIREFAGERLAASGEEPVLLDRLGRYLVALGRELGAPMYYVDQADVFARLDTEHANVRAVMEWALEAGRAELAGELVATFHIVWLARGQHFHETQQWLERVLEFRGQVSDPVWAQVLIAASDSRKISGDRAGVTQVAEELVRTMEGNTAVDPLTVASALADLADMAIEEGELERATALAKRSLAFREAHGLPGARALTSLGEIARLEGDLERAARSIETAAAEYRNSGFHVNYSSALVSLGEIACQRRDFDAAVAYLTDALAVQSRLGDQVGIGESLRSLALVARDQGRPVRAGRLWSAGTAILDSLGVQPSAQREAAKLEWHADAVGEGAAMSVEEAVEYALASID